MAASCMPKGLSWLFFAVGVGTLIACGIYLGRAIGDGGTGWRILHAVVFLVLGVFFILRYGESTSARSS